jgi:2,5-diketo-D-gluconate reductase B
MPDAHLPAPGLGTYQNTDPDTCRTAVETALDVGYRHIDTAQMYENEEYVGEGLAAADVDRDEVAVATKLDSRNLGYDEVHHHARQCRDRLGIDTIDLLYVHWPIRTYDPESTLSAMDDLHDQGLISRVGLSNFTPELLTEALDVLDAPLFAHQVECHPLLPQEELRRHAREHDHYLVAYSPLAKGTVLDVPELVDIADAHDATAAQISLAWLHAKDNVVAIPKAATPAHIRENYAAREVDLTEAAIERIDDIERRERVVDFDAAPWN